MTRTVCSPLNVQRRHGLLGGAAAGLLSLMGAARATSPAALGEPVHWPNVTLLDGGMLGPDQLQDTALVLVFFSTTCPYCQRHNAHVDKLARATQDQALRVLGVAGDRDPDTVRTYLRAQAYRFAVTLDEGPLRAALTPRRVIPLTCVLDRSGRLREVIPGEMFEDDVMGLARWARPTGT